MYKGSPTTNTAMDNIDDLRKRFDVLPPFLNALDDIFAQEELTAIQSVRHSNYLVSQ